MAPKAAKPTQKIFDPFNSTATGHQRADNVLSGSTSWRNSRTLKLNNQYIGGIGGGEWVSDTVGAGSLDFGKDGRTANGGWVRGASGLRTGGQRSILESMQGIKVEKPAEMPAKRLKTEDDTWKPTVIVNPFTPYRKEDGSIRETSWTSHESSPSHLLSPIDANTSLSNTPTGTVKQNVLPIPEPVPQIFANLNVLVNGSTAPLISDHKIKQLLSNHGAHLSISLGRKTVTHVIVGRPSSNGGTGGGGLSGTKLQKEAGRIGGNVVHFVTAEWVLESVEAGKRLPESRFAALKSATNGAGGIHKLFDKKPCSKPDALTKDEGG